MGFWALSDQFFVPAKVMVQRNLKLCRLYPSNGSYPSEFLQIFSYYNSGVYDLLKLRYSSILSSYNSKNIIVKNLLKFLRIATRIRIKSIEFQIF